MKKKILIVDAFPLEIRNAIEDAVGKHSFGGMLVAILDKLTSPRLDCDVVYALDRPPDLDYTQAYDGFIWTGSSLSAIDESDDIKRTEDWMSVCIKSNKPIFGICYGLQLAVKMAGGRVERNQKGRETIIARKIDLTSAGEKHPMMDRRDDAYDAIADHTDHITKLPNGAFRLAGNETSDVQAAAFNIDGVDFWGVQYHPDMDLNIIRLLLLHRREEMIAEGFFKSVEDYETYLSRVERLLSEPDARDAAWQLGFDEDVLNPAIRLAELECWIDYMILGNDRAP